MADDTSADAQRRHRPKASTVFIAAFVAGAVAAVVVNRALDLHLAQSKPQVESEPIFVALRALPQGSPVTVWDVALRDTPRAMVPASAMRAGDSFEGSVLKYPLREGQPLLAVQLMPASNPVAAPAASNEEAFVMPAPAPAAPTTLVQPAGDDRPKARATAEAKRLETEPTPPPATASVSPTNDPSREPAVAKQSSVPTESAMVPIVPEVAGTGGTGAVTSSSPTTERKRFELDSATKTDTANSTKQEPTPVEQPRNAVEQQPTRVASDVEPLLEPPSRPAADLESIPSVMARSEKPADLAEPATSSGPVRYLVVPERIARQADTSFVPPPAIEPVPESSPAAVQPVVTSTPRVQQAPQSKQARAAQPSQTPAKNTPPQRTGSATTPPRSMPQQMPQQQQPPHQPTKQKQSQRQTTSPSQQQTTPQPPRQVNQQQSSHQTPDRSRTEAASKGRGPMFPNLAAGIEAMGNRWRGGGDDEAVATDQPSGQQRRK